MATSQNKPISFGILTVPYQTIDVSGPIDLLSWCSSALISNAEIAGLPGMAGMTAKSIPITFHHIASTLDPVSLTAGVQIVPTTTCETCPPLDYLLVGGPDPGTYQISEEFSTFVKKHVAEGKVLFTTCTGAACVSASGVLDGKEATTNHGFVEMAKQLAPKVKWTSEKRWVVADQGRIWTSGGACAGMDMFAHWIEITYGKDLAEVAYAALDFEPRDVLGKRGLRADAEKA